MVEPFWASKSLDEMSQEEWESLCDGCGRCCLNKLEDWDTGEIVFTNLACSLLDAGSCRCGDYANRFDIVPDCVQLTPQKVRSITWLPPTCAYRLVAEGKPLAWWHPLVSGDVQTVHDAGISVRGRVISEVGVAVEEYEHFIVDWPFSDEKVAVD
ncbi:MAG: YcgN family cysteine cluster protein [Pseudomonadota bacterium]